MQLTDDALVEVCVEKLDTEGVGIVKLHPEEWLPPMAYLVSADVWVKIAHLVPESEEATKLYMDHSHVVGGEVEE